MSIALTFYKVEREGLGNFFEEASILVHDNDNVSLFQINSDAAKGTYIESSGAINIDIAKVDKYLTNVLKDNALTQAELGPLKSQ